MNFLDDDEEVNEFGVVLPNEGEAGNVPEAPVESNPVSTLPEIDIPAVTEEAPVEEVEEPATQQEEMGYDPSLPTLDVDAAQEATNEGEEVDPSLPTLDVEEFMGVQDNPLSEPNEYVPSLPTLDVDGSGEPDDSTLTKELVSAPPLKEGQEGLTFADVQNSPDRLEIARNYLRVVSGVNADSMSDEEVVDNWAKSMRWMNANEMSLISNIRKMGDADDEGRIAMAKGYSQWEQMNSMFTNDGFMGALSGFGDYTLATLTAPSTWAGLGAGSLITKGLAKGATTAAVNRVLAIGAKSAENVMLKSAVRDPVKAGVKLIAQEARTKAVKNAAEIAAKSYAVKQGLASFGVDATINSASDILYQSHMMDAKVQDKYSLAQTMFSGASGVVSGVLGYRAGFQTMNSKLVTPEVIAEGNQRYAKARANINIPEDQVNEAVKTVKDGFINWAKAVANGKAMSVDSISDTRGLYHLFMGSPFAGSLSDGLLPELMRKANYAISDDLRDETNVTQQVLTFAREHLDNATKDAIDAALTSKDSFGISFDDMINIIAKHSSSVGQDLSVPAKISREFSETAVRNRLAQDLAEEGSEEATKLSDHKLLAGIQYIQNAWRRALVAHPGTTVVNVMGYGAAKGLSEAAETLAAVTWGGIGLAATAAKPFSAVAEQLSNKGLAKARATFQSQAYTLGKLLKPTDTLETYNAILDAIPEKFAKRLRRSQTNGIELELKGQPNNMVTRGMDRYLNTANTVAMVNLQDQMTKSLSLMGSLDRQLRELSGKGVEDTIRETGLKSVPADIWDRAIRETLEDTFSMDYTRGGVFLKGVAGAVEKMSNTAGLGFIIPFGRFMNNASSFALRYSPLGYVRPWLNKSGDISFTEAATQATVGTALLAYMTQVEGEKSKQGIPWYVEQGADGQMYDRTNLAPTALFHLMGRIAYHGINDREGIIDQDVIKSLMDQLGTIGLPATLDKDSSGITTGLMNLLNAAFGNGEEDDAVSGKSILDMIGSSLGGRAAGFLRPLEPINVAVGMINGTDQTVNTKQLEGGDLAISQATRYVDQVFRIFEDRDEKKPSKPNATNVSTGREPNPYARIMGQKQREAESYTEKMFGTAVMSEWRANQDTAIPDLDAVINERVFRYLEPRAEKIMKTNRWKNASTNGRRDMANTLLKNARTDVQNWVEATQPYGKTALDVERRKLTHRKEESVKAAMKHFNLQGSKVKDLSFREINILNNYMDIIEGYDKNLLK